MLLNTATMMHVGAILLVALQVTVVESYGLTTSFSTRRSTMTMRKGRKGLKKSINDGLGNSNVRPMGGDDVIPTTSTRKMNWVPVSGISSMADLPQDENSVKLVDTMADALMNGATNPTGAVSVVNYGGKTYCFSSSCSSCKIPLTKAKVLAPNEETGNADPRLQCDFCSATFNIRTGEVVSSDGKKGLLGGIVSGLFSSQDAAALPTYDLGEQNGKVLINLPM